MVLFCCSSFIFHPSSFAADVPAAINYQGVLLDSQGNASSSGLYRVEFRIWDDPLSSGALDLVWGRAFPVNVAVGGVFNVLLTDDGDEVSDPTPQTNDLSRAFSDEDRYLGLMVTETPAGAVSNPTEIPMRQRMVAAPFAIQSLSATDAEQASDGFVAENGVVVEDGGLDADGAAVFRETLAVDGKATLEESLQVKGSLTAHVGSALEELHVNGDARFDSAVAMHGNLDVASPSTIAGYGTVPIGGIVMWNGSTNDIPDGWALCDGSTNNGHVTPNLVDRFLAGAGDDYAVGQTGGETHHVLTIWEMPEHHHSYTTRDNISAYSDGQHDGDFWRHMDDNSRSTDSAGSDQPHENRPPYHAVFFIMRVE